MTERVYLAVEGLPPSVPESSLNEAANSIGITPTLGVYRGNGDPAFANTVFVEFIPDDEHILNKFITLESIQGHPVTFTKLYVAPESRPSAVGFINLQKVEELKSKVSLAPISLLSSDRPFSNRPLSVGPGAIKLPNPGGLRTGLATTGIVDPKAPARSSSITSDNVAAVKRSGSPRVKQGINAIRTPPPNRKPRLPEALLNAELMKLQEQERLRQEAEYARRREEEKLRMMAELEELRRLAAAREEEERQKRLLIQQQEKELMEMVLKEEQRLAEKMKAMEQIQAMINEVQKEHGDEVAFLQAMDANLEKRQFDWDGNDGWSSWEDVDVLTFPVVGDPSDLRLGEAVASPARVRWRLKPFDKGTFRFAHKGQVKQKGKVSKVMIKFPIAPSKANDYAYFLDDAESSCIAREIAKKFNAASCSAERRRVDFIEPKVLRFATRVEGQYAAMEEILEGSFERFTNNMDRVAEQRLTTVLAYGHFSWHYTRGNMMVVDLQGVRSAGVVTMTDPALHRRKQKVGHTDYGTEGMKLFFINHKCNPICKSMGLTVHASQSLAVDNTVTITQEFDQ